ncbi:hypothetical protein C9I90_09915 [Photobacterium aphoticum]|nr:hypothetical protein C9I90_09915 [Photobacterium aphoticum]
MLRKCVDVHGYTPEKGSIRSQLDQQVKSAVIGQKMFAISPCGAIYFLGDRSLAPCIMAHFVICMLIEPGLLISASRDRLGYWSEKEENS